MVDCRYISKKKFRRDIVVRRKVAYSSVVTTSGSRRPLLAGHTFEHACGFTTIPLLNRLSI